MAQEESAYAKAMRLALEAAEKVGGKGATIALDLTGEPVARIVSADGKLVTEVKIEKKK